jgi:hypothetical protein
MEVVSIIIVAGVVMGGVLFVGFLVMWLLGYVDWMDRGSH